MPELCGRILHAGSMAEPSTSSTVYASSECREVSDSDSGAVLNLNLERIVKDQVLLPPY